MDQSNRPYRAEQLREFIIGLSVLGVLLSAFAFTAFRQWIRPQLVNRSSFDGARAATTVQPGPPLDRSSDTRIATAMADPSAGRADTRTRPLPVADDKATVSYLPNPDSLQPDSPRDSESINGSLRASAPGMFSGEDELPVMEPSTSDTSSGATSPSNNWSGEKAPSSSGFSQPDARDAPFGTSSRAQETVLNTMALNTVLLPAGPARGDLPKAVSPRAASIAAASPSAASPPAASLPAVLPPANSVAAELSDAADSVAAPAGASLPATACQVSFVTAAESAVPDQAPQFTRSLTQIPAVEEEKTLFESRASIRPGDSFWTISQRVYGRGDLFRALYHYNRDAFPNPDQLPVGALVRTPEPHELRRTCPSHCRRPARTATFGDAPRVTPTAGSQSRHSYVVRKGDTLFDIARFELGQAARYVEILNLNQEQLAGMTAQLREGTTLMLPPRE